MSADVSDEVRVDTPVALLKRLGLLERREARIGSVARAELMERVRLDAQGEEEHKEKRRTTGEGRIEPVPDRAARDDRSRRQPDEPENEVRPCDASDE